MHAIVPTGGPEPELHSFFRGGALSIYDDQTRQAINILKDKIEVNTVTEIWETALTTQWEHPPVWVHGDLSVGNLLVKDGKLCAVIDFGQLAVGDPACELAIAWTFFKGKSRQTFKDALPLDAETWARGLAWTIWNHLYRGCKSRLSPSGRVKNDDVLIQNYPITTPRALRLTHSQPGPFQGALVVTAR